MSCADCACCQTKKPTSTVKIVGGVRQLPKDYDWSKSPFKETYEAIQRWKAELASERAS